MKANIHIEDDVWERFRAYVLNKHGKLYGVLGKEVSKALELYLLTLDGENVNSSLLRLLREVRKFNETVSSILAEINDAEMRTLSDFGVV